MSPDGAIREKWKESFKPWHGLEGSLISLFSSRGKSPKWTKFLQLTASELEKLKISTAGALLFLNTSQRWFAISFGTGHTALNFDHFEQDFGLRVVLNIVAKDGLKSVDVRTIEENSTIRRVQSARNAAQSTFRIDTVRDLLRGVTGKPSDPKYGTKVSGADAFVIHKKLSLTDLPETCQLALAAWKEE